MSSLARLRRRLGTFRWPSLAIAIASALIVLLCDVFVVYVVWSSHRQAVRGAESETADLARVLEEFVLRNTQGLDLLLSATKTTIEADPSLRTPHDPRLIAFLQQQRRLYTSVGGLAVLDDRGNLIGGSQGPDSPGRAFNFADRPYFQTHRANPAGGLHIDAPRETRGSGERIIVFSRALQTPRGAFDGVVLAALTVRSLHEFFAAVNVGHTGSISLFRDDGLLLARTPDNPAIVGSSMARVPLFTAHLPRADAGTFEGAGTADGVLRWVSYRRVPGLPLVVTVARANDEVLATWRANAWIYGTTAAFVNLLVLGLGALLAREVSRREASESDVRERERLIRLVADNVPMLIAYIDKNRVYRFVNRLAARWMNTPITAFPGRKVEDVLPPAFYERSKERIEAALAGTHLAFEERRVYPDGRARWADVSYVPVREGSEIGGYIVLVSDITDRKAAEERLREREEQLRQAQKMEVVGQLTGGVAHDFNNLLGVIVGNLDLLAMDLKEPRQRETLQRAIDAVERGGTLTRQLLAFSRKQMLQPQSIDVGGLLAEVGGLLRRTLGEGVEVTTATAEGQWPCLADRHQLETALLNLALNARDAMPKGGRLTISGGNTVLDEAEARRQAEVTAGAYVTIAVRDDGVGMTADIAAHAFEPFFTTKEVGKGSGLGLSMVYGFCKQSGGHVRLASRPGHGTVVTLYLPRAAHAAAAAAPEPALPHGRGQRILVVEDNAPLREIAVTMLRNLGYATAEAGTAERALAALADHPDVALLFTDVMLPGGRSGFELATEAKRRRPGLKVLYASGHPNLDQTVPGGKLPAELPEGSVIIAKPFRAADLARRIEDALAG